MISALRLACWPPPTLGRDAMLTALSAIGIAPGAVRLEQPAALTRGAGVTVAFGDGAARALIGDAWPGWADGRGYLWDTPAGRVLGTAHPDDVVKTWTPWRALLDVDLRRAAAEAAAGAPPLEAREVRVVTTHADAMALELAVRGAACTAVDIENTRDFALACVGFAPSPERAWVVPTASDWQRALVKRLCESLAPKVLQNGQYDRYFLKRFCGIEVRGQVADTMLAWHALNPELAGKAIATGDRRSRSGRTAKSLKFLASIYTRDAWWKEYDFGSEDDRYRLCGLDVCVTLDVWRKQAAQLDATGLRPVHDFELALLDPCLAMTERGLRVDEAKRHAMLTAIDAERDPLTCGTDTLMCEAIAAKPERVPAAKAHLFEARYVCRCCRNGAAKRVACWSCAGLAKAPGKRETAALPAPLGPCRECGGAGEFRTQRANPASPEQVGIVLYDVLKLPVRTQAGRRTTDEEALKSLLAEAKSDEATGLIRSLLRLGKLDTICATLERVKPGPDGRIRTVYNPAGTVTGRFASSETFLTPSTNLSNLPKREATEAMFDVKACFVPDAGDVFVEADLSGAEAWVTAACAGDHALLERLRAGLDIHKWTAAGIFSRPIEAVTPTDRHLGKVARHALNYGMQWQTFQREVNFSADRTGVAISARQAKAICDGYHALHPRLRVWWQAVLDEIVCRGTLTTTFGRRRTFYGRGRGEFLSETHRSAIAQEPQSTIADLLNRGLMRWWRQHDGRAGRLVAQVYDSVLIQCARSRAPLVAQLVRRCLTETISVRGVTLTIPVDVKILDSWAAAKD
jgi:DNA polymerase I-like protein with 3'-5' exonuclease and polymerase domains